MEEPNQGHWFELAAKLSRFLHQHEIGNFPRVNASKLRFHLELSSPLIVAVEPYHMDRYLDEQMFRFNNRIGMTDSTRFMKALSQVANRRVTYAELTGKEANRPRTKPGPLRGHGRIAYDVKASLLSKLQLRRGRKPRLP